MDEWTQKLNKAITEHNKKWGTHESFSLRENGASRTTIQCGVCGNTDIQLNTDVKRPFANLLHQHVMRGLNHLFMYQKEHSMKPAYPSNTEREHEDGVTKEKVEGYMREACVDVGKFNVSDDGKTAGCTACGVVMKFKVPRTTSSPIYKGGKFLSNCKAHLAACEAKGVTSKRHTEHKSSPKEVATSQRNLLGFVAIPRYAQSTSSSSSSSANGDSAVAKSSTRLWSSSSSSGANLQLTSVSSLEPTTSTTKNQLTNATSFSTTTLKGSASSCPMSPRASEAEHMMSTRVTTSMTSTSAVSSEE